MRVAATKRIVLAAGLAAGVVVSCREPTEARVQLYTDVVWQSGRSVDLHTANTAEPSLVVDRWSGPAIGDVVIVPSGDKSGSLTLRAVLGVSKPSSACTEARPDGCIFARRRLSFRPHVPLTLPVVLSAACIGKACDDGTTCNSEGRCVSADVSPDQCAGETGCFVEGDKVPAGTAPGSAIDGGGGGDDGGRDVRRDGGRDDSGEGKPFVTQLALGGYHSCALWNDGVVKCWGKNVDGQIGLEDGSLTWGAAPGQMGKALPEVKIASDQGAFELSGGAMHTCAALPGGVKCWGTNGSGELGLGDTSVRGKSPGTMGDALPYVDLGPGVEVKHVRAGGSHTCAMLASGGIKCWGLNDSGQLGRGDANNRGDGPGEMGAALPQVDLAAPKVTDLAMLEKSTCARSDTGQIKCWGLNDKGQLGIGVTSNRGDKPAQMGGLLMWAVLGATFGDLGPLSRGTSACAANTAGFVQCWGDNTSGALGLGDTNHRGDQVLEMGLSLPVVDVGFAVAKVDGGVNSHCALSMDRTKVKCWGDGGYGLPGRGSEANAGELPGQMGAALAPIDFGTTSPIKQLAMGGWHACVLFEDHRVKCWGRNDFGQLGVGDTNDRGDQPGEMGAALPYVNLGR